MQLTLNQKKIKQEIVDLVQEKFDLWTPEPIWFTAPTGAGKTFVISKVIEEILIDLDTDISTAVLFFTLSQASLPQQVKKKFENYRVRFKYACIKSPSNKANDFSDSDLDGLESKSNYVYIFGIGSLSINSILLQKNRFDLFIETLANQNNRILIIWDEAHIRGTNSNNKFQNQVISIIKKYFRTQHLIVKMTATIPSVIKNAPIIKMTEWEAECNWLIKSQKEIICDDQSRWTYQGIINQGLKKFKQIKYKYQQDGNINPAILVQIKKQAEKDAEWNHNLKILQKAIEDQGLNWCLWTSKNKKISKKLREIRPSPSYLSKPDCEIDVIVFIYALATGWDIPRACMLMQLTELKSKQLTEQTIGRIRRNPTRPLQNIKNTFYDQYYLYTNLKEDKKLILSLKQKYEETKFLTLQVNPKKLERRGWFYRKESIKKYLKQHKGEIFLKFGNYFQTINYKVIKRDINSWRERYRKKTIINLLELAQIWRERLPIEKLRKIIEEWSETVGLYKAVNYQDVSFLKATSWEWRLFWLNDKKYLSEVEQIWKSERKLSDEQITVEDLNPPLERAMKETGKFIFQSKSKCSLKIDQECDSFFPYTANQSPVEIWVDSETEKQRIEKWFQILKQWKRENKISDLQLTCKNFIQLRINYELWDNEKDQESRQHPDLIVRFKNNGLEYTLLIEIKSLQHSTTRKNQTSSKYENRIKMIKQCYPKFAQKLKNCNYTFILDLTDQNHKQAITWWQRNHTGTVTDVEKCLQQIFLNQKTDNLLVDTMIK